MTDLEYSSLVQCVKDIKKLTNGLNDLVVNVHVKDKDLKEGYPLIVLDILNLQVIIQQRCI